MTVGIRDNKERVCRFIACNDRYKTGFSEAINQVQCNTRLHRHLGAPEHKER